MYIEGRRKEQNRKQDGSKSLSGICVYSGTLSSPPSISSCYLPVLMLYLYFLGTSHIGKGECAYGSCLKSWPANTAALLIYVRKREPPVWVRLIFESNLSRAQTDSFGQKRKELNERVTSAELNRQSVVGSLHWWGLSETCTRKQGARNWLENEAENVVKRIEYLWTSKQYTVLTKTGGDSHCIASFCIVCVAATQCIHKHDPKKRRKNPSNGLSRYLQMHALGKHGRGNIFYCRVPPFPPFQFENAEKTRHDSYDTFPRPAFAKAWSQQFLLPHWGPLISGWVGDFSVMS